VDSGGNGGHRMKINEISGAGMQAGQAEVSQTVDMESKNIQGEIVDARKKLKNLSSDQEMSSEEKMKKRQEIQKQISDLNNRLRQHQIEERKKEQEEKRAAQEKAAMDSEEKEKRDSRVKDAGDAGGKGSGEPEEEKAQKAGVSQGSMHAMISAGADVSQAQVQGSVASRIEGRIAVLESEIKLDENRGGSTEAKEKEVGRLRQKAGTARTPQGNALGSADKAARGALKTEKEKAPGKITGQKREGAAQSVNARLYTSAGTPAWVQGAVRFTV